MRKNVLSVVKRRFIYGLVTLYSLSGIVSTSWAQNESVETIVNRVASHVIDKTSFKFIDTKTKKVYSSPDSFPPGANIKTQSLYNKWEYANGVLMIGMLQAAKEFDHKEYADYVHKNFDFIFQHVGFFKEHYAGKAIPEWRSFFRMGALDDCGALAAALADANQDAKSKTYSEYLNKAANYILHKQLRLDDGTLCRNNPRNMTIWADDLYMSVPFLARMGKLTGDNKYFDDAVKQVLNFNKYLYDSTNGLYFHCWYSDVRQNGVAHWLRCNGWIAMAEVELLRNLPPSHPAKKEIIACLLRQLIGVSRFQDPSGLWHQVIDKPDSYLETSGTAMFVYATAKAVNEKWIPATYKSIAIEGWKGLSRKVTADGLIEDVCVGTNINDNISFYYNRPKVLNDFHALGATLLAGVEMIKLEKAMDKRGR